MAAVKEGLSVVALPQRDGASRKFDLLRHLVTAHEALLHREVPSKGILRELVSNTAHLAISIGGHRGMGENLLNDHEPLNLPNLWRENSIKSFMKAYQYGVRFVEMDVQVTADGVPVIWHDDDILFGSQTEPMVSRVADLHYDEFKSLGPIAAEHNSQMRELIPLHRRFRSRHKGDQSLPSTHTAWHCFDDDPLPSLEDVLTSLPLDLALNLEIKMTTPATLAITPTAEIERATQPIIDLLQQRPITDRSIVISCFDPDVCMAVQAKLETTGLDIPVMYLTEGGFSFHADPRRTSLPIAIEFCKDHGLMGIVVNTSCLRSDPGQMENARRHGLKVMTYGLENDDVGWLMEQCRLGVHGAIVDDVSRVVPRFIQQLQSSTPSMDRNR